MPSGISFGTGVLAFYGKVIYMSFIFSLTSHQKRFEYLDEVVHILYTQNIRPDQIIINIAQEDRPFFKLNTYKDIEVNFLEEDLKAMNKLLPTIERYPDQTIITVDDDVRYPANLSEILLNANQDSSKDIIAGRARQITEDSSGYLGYEDWPLLFDGQERSPTILPTGVGGTLYPPGSLHKDISDRNECVKYVYQDDLWWYAQARRANTQFIQVPVFSKSEFPNIDEIARDGLYVNLNRGQSKNDLAFKMLLDTYGDFVKF